MAPVFLSQVCVVVDQASYDALRHSDEIRALASAAEETVGASRGKWTAFYIMGRQTVIQILSAGANHGGPRRRLGQSGIGLGYIGAENLAPTEKRLRLVFGGRVKSGGVARKTPYGDVSWFPELDVDGKDSDVLSTWFMEITPGYLLARYPGAHVEDLLSRQQYIATSFRPDRLLDDVVGVTLALDQSEASVLIGELGVAGWTLRKTAGETVMTGPDAAITIVPADLRFGLREVELRLRRPAPQKETALGSAGLLLKGETGRLSFQGPR
jgi:Family of unknown function (DUF5829)